MLCRISSNGEIPLGFGIYPTPIEKERQAVFDAVKRRFNGIVILEEKADIPRIAHRLGTSWEHAASLTRRRRLQLLAKRFNAQIATGHNYSDYEETLELRRRRGIPEAGIPPLRLVDSATQFMRPLYRMRRDTVRQKVTALGLPYFDDPENTNTDFERNRIRYECNQKARRVRKPANRGRPSVSLPTVIPRRELRYNAARFHARTNVEKARLVFQAFRTLAIVHPFTRNDFERARRLPFALPPFFAHEEIIHQKKYIVFRRGLGVFMPITKTPEKHCVRGDSVTRSTSIAMPYGKKSVAKILSERKLSPRERRLTYVYLQSDSPHTCTKIHFSTGEILSAWKDGSHEI
ncbi:MAG TPA: ATP-binding protein [Turneriella sp.]|nr:ATP-binding protein [Turneriella sp.]